MILGIWYAKVYKNIFKAFHSEITYNELSISKKVFVFILFDQSYLPGYHCQNCSEQCGYQYARDKEGAKCTDSSRKFVFTSHNPLYFLPLCYAKMANI